MLLEPTIHFTSYIIQSAHYLNNPKHMYNSMIHDLTRGYCKEDAYSNLVVFFSQSRDYKNSREIRKVVSDFQSILNKDFRALNINDTDDVYVEARKYLDSQISAFMVFHQTYYPYGGGKNNQPSYPFRKTL